MVEQQISYRRISTFRLPMAPRSRQNLRPPVHPRPPRPPFRPDLKAFIHPSNRRMQTSTLPFPSHFRGPFCQVLASPHSSQSSASPSSLSPVEVAVAVAVCSHSSFYPRFTRPKLSRYHLSRPCHIHPFSPISPSCRGFLLSFAHPHAPPSTHLCSLLQLLQA